jgi:hypothetical protein
MKKQWIWIALGIVGLMIYVNYPRKSMTIPTGGPGDFLQ